MISRILPLLALVLAAGLFFGYVNPTRTDKIAETKSQIQSYESALIAAERFKQKENELIIARAAIPSESLARLSTFLPDGVDNVQIILDLNSLAARSGMTLSDFDSSSDTANEAPAIGEQEGLAGASQSLESEGPVESLDIRITATGTYASFRQFLAGIEQSLRMLDVVSVKVDDSDTGVYSYDMTIRLYWLQ